MSFSARIIRDEHRALTSVVKSLQFPIQEIQNRKQTPDFPLLHSMIDYIEQFPDKLHHPKEDKYQFPALRQRRPAAAAELDVLEDAHKPGTSLTDRVAISLRDGHADQSQFDVFAPAGDVYANFQWAHMSREENEILPLAEKYPTPEDWRVYK